jgi:putative ABC transport system substrate-binding protein
MRELGYVEGQNFIVEYRSAEGRQERFPSLALDLVGMNVDLIVALATPHARAAQQATRTIPIVVPAMSDPVADGLVASLARPGGNITGLTTLGAELTPKRVDLLKQALPGLSRVAVLWHPGATSEQTASETWKAAETASASMRLQLRRVDVPGPDDIDDALDTIARERFEALLMIQSSMFFTERRRIADLVAKHRLPSIFNAREFAALGGLMAYGASTADRFRRSASYVDKILKGAKPADLAVEQPTKFELVINLKAAKALGLEVPPHLIAQADELIE